MLLSLNFRAKYNRADCTFWREIIPIFAKKKKTIVPIVNIIVLVCLSKLAPKCLTTYATDLRCLIAIFSKNNWTWVLITF